MKFKFEFIKILAPFQKRAGVWQKLKMKKLNDLLQCMLKWQNMVIIIGGLELKSCLTIKRLPTLVSRIDVHARLLILRKNSPLHGLILVCTFIVFEKKIPLHVYFPAFLLVFALHVY